MGALHLKPLLYGVEIIERVRVPCGLFHIADVIDDDIDRRCFVKIVFVVFASLPWCKY